MTTPTFVRQIGALGATEVVAGSMLGLGIFPTPNLVARGGASPGLFVLGRRAPKAERPYRASLYPVLPLLYLATALAVEGLEVRDVVTCVEGTSPLPFSGIVVFAAAWLLQQLVAGGR